MNDFMTSIVKNLISVGINCFMVYALISVDLDLMWAMFIVVMMEIHFMRQEMSERKGT